MQTNTTTTREFIPDINAANEEIQRLDAQIAELKGAKPPKPAEQQPKGSTSTTPLTGVQRAMAANVQQQKQRAN